MPRAVAHIRTNLWADPDFRKLPSDLQRLTMCLLTQPDLDSAGMVLYRPHRWAGFAPDITAEAVARMVGDLAAAERVAVDFDHDEVLVLDYFQHNNVAAQPKRVVAAIDAIGDIHSQRIAALASGELAVAVESAPISVPRGRRAAVLARDGHRCKECRWKPGDPVPQRNGRPLYRVLEIDHIHPRALGGGNEIENLQVLCTTCNARKGARV